ncbi:cytochrome C5 [Microbacterium sp. CJ88]|uniref:cytochrome C5 n=1 Tax=Microbacterium sp. CJ88 TaxID=3445672 RepID=UPI003F6550A6
MPTADLATLQNLLTARGVLDEATVDVEDVFGRTRLDAADVDVTVNVDPETDDDDEPDLEALVDATARILAISERRWRQVVDAIATEIEEAAGDPNEITETIDLREDLEIHSIAVFPGATLLSFHAPRQFPDAWIRAQLDDDLDVEFVEVDTSDTDTAVDAD